LFQVSFADRAQLYSMCTGTGALQSLSVLENGRQVRTFFTSARKFSYLTM